MSAVPEYRSFHEFYPFYLGEHRNPICRRLHFIGTFLVIANTVYAMLTGHWLWLLVVPVCGYAFAWVGHFFYEHNRPATFKYPFFSLAADFVMFKDMMLGRVPF
jgi:hypothetical protein